MKVEVLYDVAVSKNTVDNIQLVTCAYPVTTLARNGIVFCIYRRGKKKHSYDGIWVVQNSKDNGQTWSEPVTIFDGRHLEPPEAMISGGICEAVDGSLVIVFTTIQVTKKDHHMFSEEGFKQQYQHYIARSYNSGITWSAPELVEHASTFRMGISKPFVLPNGELLVPAERTLSNGVSAVCVSYSTDNGKRLGPFNDCITDPSAKLNYSDPRFTLLPNGKIMAMLWTFRQDNEETIEVHQSTSEDNGRTWSKPQPVGYLGQITVPLILNFPIVIAASNYRWTPEGIRLWLSRDGGKTWLDELPIQMWDPHQNRILAQPMELYKDHSENKGVWKALPGFTFGTPDLVALLDGTVLLSYYATVEGVTHVRACRFKLEV